MWRGLQLEATDSLCKLIIRIMDFFFLNQSKKLYIVLSRE